LPEGASIYAQAASGKPIASAIFGAGLEKLFEFNRRPPMLQVSSQRAFYGNRGSSYAERRVSFRKLAG
jgi:hypothetical protein